MIQRILVTLLVLGLVIGGGYYGIQALMPAPSGPAAGPLYATRPVERGTIRVAVESFGNLEPVYLSSIEAAADGFVEAVYIEEGQTVEEGQLVALIRNDELGYRLTELEIEIERLKAELARLLGISPEQVMDANPEGEIIVRSPITGRVEGLTVHRDGREVPISSGTDLRVNEEVARIVDDSKLIIPAELFKAEFDHARVGGRVEVRVPGFEGFVEGVITEVNDHPIARDGVFVYSIVVEIQNPGLIQPGQEAGLTLVDGSSRVTVRRRQVIDHFSQETRVYTPIEGTAVRVYVRPGAQVNSGDPLVAIGGQGSAQHIQQKQLELRQKLLELEQQTDVRNRLEIRSAISGTVNWVAVQAGSVIQQGWHVASIFDNKNMHLNIRVDELDVVHIEEGMEARVTSEAMPGRAWKATVQRVDMMGRAEDGIAQYGVFLVVADTGEMRPGMSANVEIFVGEEDDALLIPIEAVFEHDGDVVVEVLEDGRPKIVAVKLGLVSDRQAQVLEGLTEGQEVIVGSTMDRLEGEHVETGGPSLPMPPGPGDGGDSMPALPEPAPEPMPVPDEPGDG